MPTLQEDTMIGQNISHYRIIEKLGEGGMGVVYLAEDTKLKRTVALKFLPPLLTHDQSTRKQFLVEARAESALDHPNICNIHEINETEPPPGEPGDGQLYICMAYYAGDSLKEKIKKGPLPIAEAIDICIQIARGLSAAHENNIIHRDIKPSNILITDKGEVKIVDFGLAKLAGEELSKSLSTKGTVAYMAPEIIRGLPGDKRADIWSLGVILYEMLSGYLPFKGEFAEPMMYAIVNKEPASISKLLKDRPESLQSIIDKLLKKDPADRYQDVIELIGGLYSLLKEMQMENGKSSEISPKRQLRGKTVFIIVSVILSFISLVIISLFITNPFSGEIFSPMKKIPFTVLPGVERYPTFSPDGTQIAFTWFGENGDNSDIYVKLIGVSTQDLDRLTEHPGRDFMPSWSPDGRYIAFARTSEDGSSICMITVRGKSEKELVPVNFGNWSSNISWSTDSKSFSFSALDSSSDFDRIFLLSIDNKRIQELTDGPDQNLNDYYSAISPDGKTLAFTRGIDKPSSDIYVVPMTGGKAMRLTSDNNFIRGLTWTMDGKEIIYNSGLGSSRLWRISAAGGEITPIPVSGENHFHPVLSTQGNLLACEEWDDDINIWRVENPKSENLINMPSKLIYTTHQDDEQRYSPDGTKIAYRSFASGSSQIWICDSNGDNKEQLTHLDWAAEGGAPHWSPDGRSITFDQMLKGQHDIFTVSIQRAEPVKITNNSATDHSPRYSRDGRWLYFNSNRSGSWQIWKIPMQGGRATQVTENGGYIVYESYDGMWVYYRKYDTQGVWRMALPKGEEEVVLNYKIGLNNWILSNDGIYFIMLSEQNKHMIYFYDFKTENIEGVLMLGNKYIGDIEVSPDQNWILYSQADEEESDIILIENFR
jgi:serine/threonine protein kinase